VAVRFRNIHQHERLRPINTQSFSRNGFTQNDQTDILQLRDTGLSLVHGELVRTPLMDRFSQRGQQLELPLLPQEMGPRLENRPKILLSQQFR